MYQKLRYLEIFPENEALINEGPIIENENGNREMLRRAEEAADSQ